MTDREWFAMERWTGTWDGADDFQIDRFTDLLYCRREIKLSPRGYNRFYGCGSDSDLEEAGDVEYRQNQVQSPSTRQWRRRPL